MARERGIETLVDGAHGFAHFPFTRDDLDCDYYATSLHKWLYAPVGTGFLYIRRERIRDLWPLMAAPLSMRDDIRKFEEIGTHPIAIKGAITEALTFHDGIGAERKAERRLRAPMVRPRRDRSPGAQPPLAPEPRRRRRERSHEHLEWKYRIYVRPRVSRGSLTASE
jgi:selenocysteine lyase/cysteine desulfurase